MIKNDLLAHLGIPKLKKLLKSSSNAQLVKILRCFCFIAILLLYYLTFRIFQLSTAIVYLVFPRSRLVYDNYFASGFWTLCLYILELNNVHVILTGDSLELDNSLIISNHVSLVDYLIFPYLTLKAIEQQHFESSLEQQPPKSSESSKQKKSKKKNLADLNKLSHPLICKDLTSNMLIPKLNFFTWFDIWNLPNLKLFKNISETDENWELDSNTLHSIFKKYLDESDENESPDWLITFPEVNIFNESDLKVQSELVDKYYLPVFKNLLYPRYSNFANSISGLYKTNFTRLYDVTLLYSKKVKSKDGESSVVFESPTLLDVFGLSDEQYTVIIHIQAKFMSRIPIKRNKLEKWLENRWIKKDQLITKLKAELSKLD